MGPIETEKQWAVKVVRNGRTITWAIRNSLQLAEAMAAQLRSDRDDAWCERYAG